MTASPWTAALFAYGFDKLVSEGAGFVPAKPPWISPSAILPDGGLPVILKIYPFRTSHVERPNCHHCRFFKISWNPDWPYICQAMNFRSRDIPWRVVANASGLPCQMFVRKERRPSPPKSSGKRYI